MLPEWCKLVLMFERVSVVWCCTSVGRDGDCRWCWGSEPQTGASRRHCRPRVGAVPVVSIVVAVADDVVVAAVVVDVATFVPIVVDPVVCSPLPLGER